VISGVPALLRSRHELLFFYCKRRRETEEELGALERIRRVPQSYPGL
jgi:hypothetical protein